MEEIIELEYRKPNKVDHLVRESWQKFKRDEPLIRLCNNYIDNVLAYVTNKKVVDIFTGIKHNPDEKIMRGVEEQIDISEQMADDFRRSVAGLVGACAMNKTMFTWDTNPQLRLAFKRKLNRDTHNHLSWLLETND